MSQVTKEDLKEYRTMKRELEQIKKRLYKMNSHVFDDIDREMLSASVRKSSSRNALRKLVALKKEYSDRFEALLSKEKDIQAFIDSIEDRELATYIMMKYINDTEVKSEEELGELFHYDRTTLPKRLNRLFDKKDGE
ncbi:MAG: hypothetical protein E7517_01800 [Ruminococcaceae bacterium]|nr:hypothetical protein [Oscillospiraceae bacterium]